jgi:two-component system chemotaxis response regulator CheV
MRFNMSTPATKTSGDILLDAGTNELEVLVFGLAGGLYGVNVAKVREVIKPMPVTAAPHQHASVQGTFNIRGNVLPVVDLASHLSLTRKQPFKAEGRVIITEFNGLRTGFLVDTVDQIYRMGWEKIRPAPEVGSDNPASVTPITGVIEMKDKLILMIDFESVADSILIERRLHIESVENTLGVDRASKHIVLAEDSPFMRNVLLEVFTASGYTNLKVCSNGEEAWEAVNAAQGAVDCLVSDIEMPRMDGLYLCKRIKETPALKHTPVVLFSSLISDDNRKKGQQVGADVQVSKPELRETVMLVDKVVSGRIDEVRATANAQAAAA